MFRSCFSSGCRKKSPSPKQSPNTPSKIAKRIARQHLNVMTVPYTFAKKLTFTELLSLRRQGRISEKDFWGAFNYMRRNVKLRNSREENLAVINRNYPWYYKNNNWGRYALGPTNFIVQDRNTLQFYSINRNGTKRKIDNMNPMYKYIRQIPRASNMSEKAYLKRTRVTRPKSANPRQRAIINEINRIRSYSIPSRGSVGRESARNRLHTLRRRYEFLKNLDKLQQ